MAIKDIVVDDESYDKIGNYLKIQGEDLDEIIAKYIETLEDIKKNAIKSGDVSNALSTYIMYAEKIKKQIGDIMTLLQKDMKEFIKYIDEADQYIF